MCTVWGRGGELVRLGQLCKDIRNELVENKGEKLVRVKPEYYCWRSLNILIVRCDIFAIDSKGRLFKWWHQRTMGLRVRET